MTLNSMMQASSAEPATLQTGLQSNVREVLIGIEEIKHSSHFVCTTCLFSNLCTGHRRVQGLSTLSNTCISCVCGRDICLFHGAALAGMFYYHFPCNIFAIRVTYNRVLWLRMVHFRLFMVDFPSCSWSLLMAIYSRFCGYVEWC